MTSDLEDKKHNLLFSVRRSVRYHFKRRLFYDRLSNTASVFSAFSGSATIASALGSAGQEYTLLFATIVAISSAVNLALQPAKSSRTHHDLAKKFIHIEKDLVEREEFSLEEINKLISRRLDVEAEEPPPLRILDCVCHNELLRAMGYGKEHMVKLTWYQRLFKDFFDINEHKVCA